MKFIKLAKRRDIVKRSTIVAIVVGTILNLINQGDALMDPSRFELVKCLLTYLVPYCVATYGAVSAIQADQQN